MKRIKQKFIVCLTILFMVGGFMTISSTAFASDPFIGQIETFGFNFPPRGWAHCDGQLLQISTNTALFSLLGTTFGGDGDTIFGLPDLRGRVAVHVGSGTGLSPIIWGQRGGTEMRTLTVANMPSHNHTATINAFNAKANSRRPGGRVLARNTKGKVYSDAAPNVTMSADSVTVGNTGSGQEFSVRDPFLGIYHSIALVGLFPSRN